VNAQVANTQTKNVFRKFYGSRTFDIVFGVTPAVLMILFSLFVIVVTVDRLSWTAVGWIPVKYLFILSLIGFGSCVSLVSCIFNGGHPKGSVRKFHTLMLWLGVFISAVVIALVYKTGMGRIKNVLEIGWPMIGVIPLSLAAIKQINLLNMSELRRPS
jgi:Co/Zn/Cd efflux system component